ncbi:hypothetical protein CNMCM6936_002715 [Aspergillus lentulus]|nr:hypothetical protein CNMCM6936_002715 [Aspergillus lentulus]
MFATSAALVALATLASGQNAIPAADVPFIGGGVFQRNDPYLANYTFVYRPPFDAKVYGDYYRWSVNNETVAIANLTEDRAKGPVEGQKFKKIHHVIFENEVFSWTMSDPYWQLLARRGKLLTNSHGVTHPSLPNYAALLAGDFFGMDAEDFYNIDATTIYDLLDVRGINYAMYVEWYSPAATKRGSLDCNNYIFNGPIDSTNPEWSSQVYRRLGVPALLFSTYTSEYERCAKIYNATEKFADDVMSGKLPAYSYYVPDMLHNGHDPMSDSAYVHQTTTSGYWFNAFLDLYLPELEKQGTLVVATFDEATWQNDDDTAPNNNNQILTLVFRAGITLDTENDSYMTHYGVLRGAIQNFGLGSLGRNDTKMLPTATCLILFIRRLGS